MIMSATAPEIVVDGPIAGPSTITEQGQRDDSAVSTGRDFAHMGIRARLHPDGSTSPLAWRRLALRLLLILAVASAGFLLVFAAFQESLIFPGRATQGRPEARFRPPPGTERIDLTLPGPTRIAGLFGRALGAGGLPHLDAARCPTVLYFYGNGMCLATSLGELDFFRRLGANVLIVEYPGYGLSEGRPGGAEFADAADAALEYLRARPDVDPRRIVVSGWSLGGGVAIGLAARAGDRVAGLAAFSTFTSLADVAHAHWPLLPASLLLRHRFDSERLIRSVTCPILLAHGRRDAIIPYHMMARLAAAPRTRAETLTIEEANHNDFFDLGSRDLAAALERFLAKL